MNTAMRTITTTAALPTVKSKASVRAILMTKELWLTGTLLLAIFISSLGVVYVQAMDRLLFGELQSLQKTRDSLAVEWGQLLIEQNTWATQARIQQIAEQKIQMFVPSQKDIVVVTE